MRLANEKTIELNVTHEIMAAVGVGAIGFTQQMEAQIGADVLFPCGAPFIVQYKATKRGRDGVEAAFKINNNSNRTQHRALDAISRSGLCEAVYAFPLTVTDRHFVMNQGWLLRLTIFVDAHSITDSAPSRGQRWFNSTHVVTVDQGGHFQVTSSEIGSGKGLVGDVFIRRLKKRMDQPRIEEDELTAKSVHDLIKKMEQVVRKAEVKGRTEHTMYYLSQNRRTGQHAFIAFPILLRGMVAEASRDRHEDR
jgi:hypothetical protein